MGYIKRNVKTYLYTYDEVIRDVESDTILETHTGTIEIDSTKKNPYEDFWKWAADRRKLFAKNERNQGKSIYIEAVTVEDEEKTNSCLLYTSPSPRDNRVSRMPSSA